MKKSETTAISLFRKRFQKEYPYISYDMTDEQVANKLFELRDASLEKMMDRFSDYLLSQGVCDVQE